MPNKIFLALDNKKTTKRICGFLKKEFKQRKKSCGILGISGGVDSTTAAFLLKKAEIDFYAVSLPYGKIVKKDKVKKLVQALNLSPNKFIEIDITKIVDEKIKTIQKTVQLDKIDKGNIMARTRMIILYALARKFNGLVIGTENLSEYWLGYFTLHGDCASDINPIAWLWKSQVQKLAKYLGAPAEILKQKPSAELWQNQTDEKELGFSYQKADPILELFCVKKYSKRKIIKDYGFNANLVELILNRVKQTEYKRQLL
jgi:NAD+ synthase